MDNIEKNEKIPGGGFPPIFICRFDKTITENAEKNLNKIREFAQIKQSISIKDIMNQKKKEVVIDINN